MIAACSVPFGGRGQLNVPAVLYLVFKQAMQFRLAHGRGNGGARLFVFVGKLPVLNEFVGEAVHGHGVALLVVFLQGFYPNPDITPLEKAAGFVVNDLFGHVFGVIRPAVSFAGVAGFDVCEGERFLFGGEFISHHTASKVSAAAGSCGVTFLGKAITRRDRGRSAAELG